MFYVIFAIILISINCSLVGPYVVLRRISFIGDAIAHTILPGIVIAYMIGFNNFWGALVAAIITAIGIGWFTGRNDIREDTAIGIIFTALFALGILLMSKTDLSDEEFHHMLFGDILTIGQNQLIIIAAISVVILITEFLLRKELELATFDPMYSKQIGSRPDILRYVILILIALTVVSAIQAAGILLVSALLITPSATSIMLSNKLFKINLISIFVSILSCTAGIYLAFKFNVSASASIVIVVTIIFAVVWLNKSNRNSKPVKR